MTSCSAVTWMFTGIVSAVSKVVSVEPGRIGIDHAGIARHLKVGGSVAVNGCCLTVVKKRGPVFYADMVPETLRRTNLGALKEGTEVNLELPVSAGSLLEVTIAGGYRAGSVVNVEADVVARYVARNLRQ